MALIGVRRALLIKPKAVGSGPITVALTASASVGGSSPNWTLTGVSVGNPIFILTRRVYITVVSLTQTVSAVLSGSTIGGVACDVAQTIGNTNGVSLLVYSAVLTSGITANANLVTSAGLTLGRCRIYTADNSLISTPTPVSSYSLITGGITTLQANVATLAGGAMLFASAAPGISAQSITASDSGMTQDDVFNVSLAGHSSNVAASAANHVTESWTTAASTGAIGLMAIR